MPRLSYTVKDTEGKTITGTDDAPDEATLVSRLQKQGYYVIRIEPFAAAATPQVSARTKKKSKFTHNKVKLEDLLTFCHQLATMIDAGVALLRSLNIIAMQVESKQLAEALEQVKEDVEQGTSLSSSLAKHPKVFNQFWISLVEVGEASGTMPTVLEKLAFYLEQQAAFRSSVISAIIYPAMLFCVAIGAILFFALFIGPKFKSIFDQFDVELPMITSTLLNLFDLIKSKFFISIGTISAILIMIRQYGKTHAGKLRIEKILFSLPTFGTIYKTIIVERFASQMSILIDSGVPILYALDITQRMIGNTTCFDVIANIKEGVREGKLLAEPMVKSDFFPPMPVQMIMVGEETGELGKMLKKVSEFYQTSVQTFMKRFGVIFEPFMLIFMGFIIGTIVIAMFLPIFKLAEF